MSASNYKCVARQNQPLARVVLMAGLFLRGGGGEVRAGGSGTSGQCIAVFAPCWDARRDSAWCLRWNAPTARLLSCSHSCSQCIGWQSCVVSHGTSVWECSASESSCCSSFCRCEAPSAYRNWSAHIRPDQYVCSTFLSSLSDLPEWVPALWNSLIWECLSPVQYVLCWCRLCISSVWFCK